jgi:hypothetical protein
MTELCHPANRQKLPAFCLRDGRSDYHQVSFARVLSKFCALKFLEDFFAAVFVKNNFAVYLPVPRRRLYLLYMSNSTSLRLLGVSIIFGALMLSSALLSGCSSMPRSKGYDKFSNVTATAHDYVRDTQRKQDNNQYAKADAISEHIGASLSDASCFKIVSSTFQWGLLEPEIVFKGEGQEGAQALIVVPPTLEDKERFPTPAEIAGIQVYRIDEEAPFGPKLVRMLESMLGRTDLCVSFTRAPASETRDTPVIGATALPVAAQRAIASKAAEAAPSKADVAETGKAQESHESKDAEKSSSKPIEHK